VRASSRGTGSVTPRTTPIPIQPRWSESVSVGVRGNAIGRSSFRRRSSLAFRNSRSAPGRPDSVRTTFAARQADREHVTVQTVGGHYILAIASPRGPIDVLLWVAAQTGSWGELSHRAGSFAVEAGWQPQVALAPWIRGGFDY